MNHAFRLIFRARREYQERGFVGFDLLAGAFRRRRIERRPPIALLRQQFRGVAGAIDDKRMAQTFHARARLAHVGQQRNFAASAKRGVGGDGYDRARAAKPQGDRAGRETAEQHRVNGPDPIASVDGDERLGQVGQMNGDHVATAHAHGLQRIRAAANLIVQFEISETPHVAGFAFPDNRRFLRA